MLKTRRGGKAWSYRVDDLLGVGGFCFGGYGFGDTALDDDVQISRGSRGSAGGLSHAQRRKVWIRLFCLSMVDACAALSTQGYSGEGVLEQIYPISRTFLFGKKANHARTIFISHENREASSHTPLPSPSLPSHSLPFPSLPSLSFPSLPFSSLLSSLPFSFLSFLLFSSASLFFPLSHIFIFPFSFLFLFLFSFLINYNQLIHPSKPQVTHPQSSTLSYPTLRFNPHPPSPSPYLTPTLQSHP